MNKNRKLNHSSSEKVEMTIRLTTKANDFLEQQMEQDGLKTKGQCLEQLIYEYQFLKEKQHMLDSMTLDFSGFQKEIIRHINHNNKLVIEAHTRNGKIGDVIVGVDKKLDVVLTKINELRSYLLSTSFLVFRAISIPLKAITASMNIKRTDSIYVDSVKQFFVEYDYIYAKKAKQDSITSNEETGNTNFMEDSVKQMKEIFK